MIALDAQREPELIGKIEEADVVVLYHLLSIGRETIQRLRRKAESELGSRFDIRDFHAQVLGTGFEFVSMSSLTAGWILSGASSQWKNARTGKVFDTLVMGSYANPVMVVDEIDKASSDGAYDPLGALYGLLEHDTAREFVDEFAEVPVDCSEIVWVATANDAARIPDHEELQQKAQAMRERLSGGA